MRGVESASHIGTIAEHRRELQYLEVLVLVADTILPVEYIMLPGTLQDNHHRHQQGREDDDCNAREKDVEETLEECVHSF